MPYKSSHMKFLPILSLEALIQENVLINRFHYQFFANLKYAHHDEIV